MKESEWQQVELIFGAALELPEDQLAGYLEQASEGNPAVRAEVESLLAAHGRSGRFLDGVALPSGLPPVVGRYRILRLVGEGAMGAVYEAEQEHPCRTVALKVIKTGLAGAELLRRFELESQALGRLQHPGIAQIYEAGTADGTFGPQPYFAMEFIRGESLLDYASAHQLTTRKRLELMIKVCEAVQHAHQRGIIHRDLKPGNILVDESGQPKVLDFGVAHVTGSDTRATRQTDLGQLVGTLAYMSPEQVLADPLELDTRSDVYALGVILFELLAGRLPYTISRQLPEAVQTIRNEDPARLSSISRTYRGDVETIAAKALEKDKTRRYSSAADLAADLHRYLSDEPIVARPPSASYQLQKFARRHKALVAGVAAVFAVLIAGIITSTREAARALRAEQTALRERDRAAAAQNTATKERDRALNAERAASNERNRAVSAETQAVQERNRAIAEKNRADTESATARAINDFLQNDLLAQASTSVQARPDTKPDPELKVRTALDRAAARITGKFGNQPLVEASVRQTIGNAYTDLGLYSDAQTQIERALDLRHRLLGDEHPETLGAMNDLADLYQKEGKYAQAEPYFTKVLEMRRRVLGQEHPSTLLSMTNMANLYMDQGKYTLAEPLYLRTVEVQRRLLGENHPSTLISMSSLAVLYRNQGRLAQAEPLFHKILASKQQVLGNEHPETLTSMNNLAVLYWDQGRYPQAEPLYTEVLDARRRVLGQEHPNTLNSMNNLAALYRSQGRYAEAEPLVTKVLEVRRRVLGDEHRETLISMSNLARLYQDQGKHAQTEPLFTKVLEVRRRVLGEEHPDSLNSMNSLARLYHDQGQYTRAEPLFIKVLEVRRRVIGPEHPDTLDTVSRLARLYSNQGKYSQADALYTQALEIRRRVLGPEHPDIASSLTSLGLVRLEQKRYGDAESLLREALETLDKKSPETWQCFDTQSILGASLAAQARFAEAEPLLVSGYQGLVRQKATVPWENRFDLQQAGERVVRLYHDWGKPEKAEEWREKLLAAAPRPGS